ncbi:MAG: bifunctional aldolase/short-chain dehydrogenase [Polyangiaceae bacterium]|nr:bifunctional aldolase/short-chain dehydrogenase [Polyangiaceae bacterium]
MESLWTSDDEAAYIRRYAATGCPPELATRVYTSHLLGRRPDLVLHGGGNTSVKATAQEVDGRMCEVLFVKGSGWDLASIEPTGFPACRLEPLLRLCELAELSDDDMVKALRSQMLDANSPTPSVEALLHALIPGKYVDHTHADAALALLDRPNGRELATEVWGTEALVLPYVMPGFVLARAVHALRDDPGLPAAGCLVLDKHGVFTWDQTARASYDRMIEAISKAEARLEVEARARTSRSAEVPHGSASVRNRISVSVRGEILRQHPDYPTVGTWLCEGAPLALANHPEGPSITVGPLTPDHVIRTKPWPLWLPIDEGKPLRSQVEAALRDYALRYKRYFDANVDGRELRRLRATPHVVLVPGHGAFCIGTSVRDAKIVADIYTHTARTVLRVVEVAKFEPVPESELFELEYWSLEQAKLGKRSSGRLGGRVAVVTGAAGGIGEATARALLLLGCHVLLSDRDESRLAECLGALRVEFGERVAGWMCDVTLAEQAEELISHCIETFGALDFVVSNAGFAPTGFLHEPTGDRNLHKSLRVNLLGHQNVASAATRWLIEQGAGGCLLFNASKAAFAPGPGFGPYAVAKSALVALMRQYAIDAGQHGIRVNAVNADRIRTGLFGGGVLEQRAAARGLTPAQYFQQNLLHRETLATDVADAFAWLCQAKATTGAVITVDGGNPAAFPR